MSPGNSILRLGLTSLLCLTIQEATAAREQSPDRPEQIQAMCVDFNWGPGGVNGFAPPGLWADADPAEHLAFYQDIGANVIQTFCVSCNGYAWYKDGTIPAQPGLETDFLRQMVARAHREGMRVMGYYCIGSNTRWGEEHPEYSYGAPSAPHLVYSDAYLDYLRTAVAEGVGTCIDGFMIDWVWLPDRQATDGKWIQSEKDLYAQLMDEPFPGEEKLTGSQEAAYGRRAIDRTWRVIHDTAKKINPDCLIWLSCAGLDSPLVTPTLLRECDWIMNESAEADRITYVREKLGPDVRLLQVITGGLGGRYRPRALMRELAGSGIEFYGFLRPDARTSLPQLEITSTARPTKQTAHMLAIRTAFRGEPNDWSVLQQRVRLVLTVRDAKLHGSTLRRGADVISHWSNPQDWIDWSFTPLEDGEYELSLQYASMANATVNVDVNDARYTVTLPAGRSWGDYDQRLVGSVKLEKNRTYRLTLKPGDPWSPVNLQKMIVQPVVREKSPATDREKPQ